MNDAKDALTLEASCYLLLGEPMKVMDLMDERLHPISDTELLAQVYQGIGNIQGAIDAYQVAMYQHLLFLICDSAPLALLNAADITKAEQIITRAIDCIDIYNMDELHPNTTAGIYITGGFTVCMEKMLRHLTCLSVTHIYASIASFRLCFMAMHFLTELMSGFYNLTLEIRHPVQKSL